MRLSQDSSVPLKPNQDDKQLLNKNSVKGQQRDQEDRVVTQLLK